MLIRVTTKSHVSSNRLLVVLDLRTAFCDVFTGQNDMIILLQIMSAMALGVCCYMVAVAMTVYDGILSMLFQPIMGGLFSAIAVVALLIIGLPIRLIPALNRTWKKYWWFSLALGGIAIGMMIFSWLPEYRTKVFDPELKQEVDSFNPTLSMGGWCVLLFAALHFYPPIAFLYPKRHKDKERKN
jgi:hypothetical protein